MTTENYSGPLAPPTLENFLALARQGYQMPQYTPDATQSGGFTAPEVALGMSGIPRIGEPETVRTILEPSRANQGVIVWRGNSGNELHYIGTDAQQCALYTELFGQRKIAAGIQDEPGTRAKKIAIVYGVEPLYKGGPIAPELHQQKRLLTEGTVLTVIAMANLVGLAGDDLATPELPMMQIGFDPNNPNNTVWIPHIPAVDTKNERTNPVPGDVVQVAVVPRTYHHPTMGTVLLPVELFQAPVVATGARLMQESPQRQTEREIAERNVAAAIQSIEAADNPKAVATTYNSFLRSCYRSVYDVRSDNVWIMESLRITPAALSSLADTIQSKNWPTAMLPACLPAAQKFGLWPSSEGSHPLGYVLSLDEHPAVQANIQPGETILGMTTGELTQLIARIIHHDLHRDGTLENPTSLRLATLLNVLDQESASTFADHIAQTLRSLSPEKLCTPKAARVMSAIYAAKSDSGHKTIHALSDSIHNADEAVQVFSANDYALYEFITAIESTLYLDSAEARQEWGVSNEQYQSRLKAARAAIAMLKRASNDPNYYNLIGPDKQDVIHALKALIERDLTI